MSVSSTNRERSAAAPNGDGREPHHRDGGHPVGDGGGEIPEPGAKNGPDANRADVNRADAHGAAADVAPIDARTDRHVDSLPGNNNKPAKGSDEELLAAYRAGNRPSFAALVERYQRELFHF